MRLWIWRNFRIELPDDWEMLQFSRRSEDGCCAFADRYQFRLEFNWRAVEGPPDLVRMMSDYEAKLKLEGTMPDAVRVQTGHWEGVEGHQGRRLVSRLGRYFPDEHCLIEVVLLCPEERDGELERHVLESVATEPGRLGCFRRWRAFGMDLLAADALTLQECRMEPAYARMAFADPTRGRRETFQRVGMVPEWFQGTVKEWLIDQAPKDVLLDSEALTVERGHSVATIGGGRRTGRLARLCRKGGCYEAAGWICPADGRLYCVAATGSDASAGIGLAGARLSCCNDLELAR